MELSAIEKLKDKRIYSIEGNIGAGKTTILKLIDKYFQDVEFVEEPVNEWQNLGGMNLLQSFYEDPKRWGFSFEFFSMLSKIKALLKVAETDKPIIIIERSMLSNKIFMDLTKELGKLDKVEYQMLVNTYNFYMEHVYPQLSGIIYLDTPVDECIKRIIKRNRGEETSIDKEYLEMLKEKFDKMANASTIVSFIINGQYDISRDGKKISDEICDFIHPNKSPKAIFA